MTGNTGYEKEGGDKTYRVVSTLFYEPNSFHSF